MIKQICFVIAFAILVPAVSVADEMVVPVEIQFPLLLKTLTFDRNLKSRVGDEIVIGLVYQCKFKASLNAKDQFMKVAKSSSISSIEGIPIRLVAIDVEETTLEDNLSKNDVNILYVAPLRALEIKKITEVSRAKQITTLTGVPRYVEKGLAVGIGTKEEKPEIIINLPAAKAEGADFSSQLLKLAKVIK
jgi:hypothetical protein